MELNFTRQKIQSLIKRSKMAEHYLDNDEVWDTLDGEIDNARMIATTSQKILDEYFKRHPNDCIENYLDKTS